ncbi:hypothetical protein [Phytohabitans kaempferiae]|uniref:MarR family transcriptional regulator n=1 Tax=Phytohabitans kaempferiae TaxID=1620943 RepID=A0ABV6M184_9ACTN
MDLETSTRQLATGLTRVAVAVQATERPAEFERTIAQQQVLLLLSRRSEVYPLSDLSADLNMTTHATMSAIATLAREGLVSVDPSPSYAPHAVRISLTEAGRAQSPELLNWAADLLAELHNLDQEGHHQLLGVVSGHIRRMQQEGQIPVTKMCVTCRFFDGYAHPGTDEPHHCWLIDKPFGRQHLRLRCPEAQPGEGPVRPEDAA